MAEIAKKKSPLAWIALLGLPLAGYGEPKLSLEDAAPPPSPSGRRPSVAAELDLDGPAQSDDQKLSLGEISQKVMASISRPDEPTEDLDENDQAMLEASARSSVFDQVTVLKGGFEILEDKDQVRFEYDKARRDPEEYVVELQAKIRVPGAPAPMPHRRIYNFLVQRTSERPRREADFEYKVLSALESRLIDKDGEPTEVLVPEKESLGAIIPMRLSNKGEVVLGSGSPTLDRITDWMRLRLPKKDRGVGQGWRTSAPSEVGSQLRHTAAAYQVMRLVRLDKSRIAVIQGIFREIGGELETSRFQSLGQDRLLFDLDAGRVIYREFRMEGQDVRRVGKADVPFQARIKGLVMEKSLFDDLDGRTKVDRLNACAALFGANS